MYFIKPALALLSALIAFTVGQSQAAGPADPGKTTAPSTDRFEVRISAPEPDVLADEVLQQAIDQAASAGGGVVLLGAGDFKLSRHADGFKPYHGAWKFAAPTWNHDSESKQLDLDRQHTCQRHACNRPWCQV